MNNAKDIVLEEEEVELSNKTEENPSKEEITSVDKMSEKDIESIEEVQLNISLGGEELAILLSALTEYNSFLKDNLKKVNSIIIDNRFTEKVLNKIKKVDELRYLIKKEVIIIDNTKPLYSIEDEGEVIGIETFTKTKEGLIIEESKPNTIGNTPTVKKPKIKPGETCVKSVSEEL